MHIQPYPDNAKKHPAKQVKQIAASIKRFGMNQPIVVDKQGIIIVGHGRYLALKELGWELKPEWVVRKEDLTPEEVTAYRLADNKLNESDWDMDIVIEELRLLDEPLLELTGFDKDLILEPEDKDDAVPEVPERPRSERGDLYQLGQHRILCGDSTNQEDVERLFNGVVPNLMVTDPPYGVNYDPAWRNESLVAGKRAVGEVSSDDKADWSEAWRLFPGNVAYVWHGGLHSAEVQTSLEASGFHVRAQIIWAKQHFVLSRGDYHWQHEPCWYAVRSKGDWVGDRKQTTIWNIKNNNSFGNSDKEETYGHGTQKPVECMLRPILNNSNAGQAVYDPFIGSGTTLIAAQKSERICYGIEIDPKYVDVVIQRYVDYIDNPVVLLEGIDVTYLWEKQKKTQAKTKE